MRSFLAGRRKRRGGGGGLEGFEVLRNFSELLDGVVELLHNLVSLLLTDVFEFGAAEVLFNSLDNR